MAATAIAKVGQYKIGRGGSGLGIFQWDYVSEDGKIATGHKVCHCRTYEEAVRTLYRLNGWGEPKKIRK